MTISNTCQLRTALAEAIAFLRTTNSHHWTELLSEIDSKLAYPSTSEIGRRELASCFGGMGSLNDLYFCNQNGNLPPGADSDVINQNFDRLMNSLYRENRLVGASLYQRLLWRFYEFKHRGELPPRIKNTFA